MKKLPTVTIGISALNEEGLLPSLITTLLKQQYASISLDKILVISDGSTDDTVSRLKQIHSPLLKVKDSKKRLGKPARINQLFSSSDSDFIVILDADIIVTDPTVIEKLLAPMLISSQTVLTSGIAVPFQRTTFAEQVAFVAFDLWHTIIHHTKNNQMYLCSGPIRAFRKSFYKQLTFPSYSADDVYPYLVCQQIHKKFAFVSSAIVYFRLPSTIPDFISQNKRFLRSKTIQAENFNPEFVSQYYTIGLQEKIVVFSKYGLLHPFWSVVYIFFVVYLRILLLLDRVGEEATWEIITSSKKSILNETTAQNTPLQRIGAKVSLHGTLLLLAPKDYLYSYVYSTNKKIQILPYNPHTREIANKLTTEIHSILPSLFVLFYGSASMGIDGEADVDLLLGASEHAFRREMQMLSQLFGRPSKVRFQHADWSLTIDGISVQIVLAKKNSKRFINQQLLHQILINSQYLQKQYSIIKYLLNGKSEREYDQKRSYYFINILRNHTSQKDIEEIKKVITTA